MAKGLPAAWHGQDSLDGSFHLPGSGSGIALVAHFTPAAEWTAMISEAPWQGAGEGWPDAYRQSLISPEEALGCMVCFWHHQWNAPAFQIYSSLLFGLPLAVTSFNRYSRQTLPADSKMPISPTSSHQEHQLNGLLQR